MARKDYGDPKTWNWPTGNEFYDYKNDFAPVYMEPYLKITKKYNGNNGRYHNYSTKRLDGNTTHWSRLNYILQDGTAVGFVAYGWGWSPTNLMVYVDINGFSKTSVWGKDTFLLAFDKGGVSRSYCFENCQARTRAELINLCKTKGDISTYCFDLIKDNNWKIPDDYPW